MKKLKRLSSGLSYSEVRERQEKSVEDASGELIPSQVVDVDLSRRQEVAPASDDRTLIEDHGDDAAELGGVEPKASKEASSIVAPPVGKGNQTPSELKGRSDRVAEPALEDASLQPAIKRPAEVNRKPSVARSTSDAESRVAIKGYAARPASGVSATYDNVQQRYGDKAAMTHLLNAAIKAFEDALEAGAVGAVETDPVYAALPKKAQTTRTLSGTAYRTIMKKIDPMNILRAGTVGTSIMQAAINWFVTNEAGQGRKAVAQDD